MGRKLDIFINCDYEFNEVLYMGVRGRVKGVLRKNVVWVFVKVVKIG